MNKKELQDKLLELGYEDIIVFDNYDYADAFIGVSIDDRAVYDYYKMIEWLQREEGFTKEDAVEWIEYNTIRALPYLGERAPIIIWQEYPVNEEVYDLKLRIEELEGQYAYECGCNAQLVDLQKENERLKKEVAELKRRYEVE